jgi:hypothetical protein
MRLASLVAAGALGLLLTAASALAASDPSAEPPPLQNLTDLVGSFSAQQFGWLTVALPGTEPWVQGGRPAPVPFAPEGFPQAFLEGLVPVERYQTVAVYPLQVVEDPHTRELTFYNAEGHAFYRLPAAPGDDWPGAVRQAFAERFAGADTAEEAAAVLAWLDPARVQLYFELILPEDLEA